MDFSTLEGLFKDQLKDLFSAENQLIEALPRMAKKAASPELKQAFQDHLKETKGHVERLQALGDELGIKLGGKKCKAMAGLIEEGKEVLDAKGNDSVIDAALIGAAQRVEHYEISAYGTARAIAQQLGRKEAAKVLGQTLGEEDTADKKLTAIAEGGLLESARAAADGEDAQA